MHRTTVASGQGGFDWLYFAARTGEDGRSWVESYRSFERLEELSISALSRLQAGRIEAGRQRLREMRQGLSGATGMPAGVRSVLDRWYLGVEGYLHYRCGELDAAHRSMRGAHEAIVQAISRHRFLILLANHCHEFGLHLARIARNRRRWHEMTRLVEEVREMMQDRRPLCVLTDGSPVFYGTLCEHVRSLELDAEEVAPLEGLFDQERRLEDFSRFVHRLHIQPGFAIPYVAGGFP